MKKFSFPVGVALIAIMAMAEFVFASASEPTIHMGRPSSTISSYSMESIRSTPNLANRAWNKVPSWIKPDGVSLYYVVDNEKLDSDGTVMYRAKPFGRLGLYWLVWGREGGYREFGLRFQEFGLNCTVDRYNGVNIGADFFTICLKWHHHWEIQMPTIAAGYDVIKGRLSYGQFGIMTATADRIYGFRLPAIAYSW